MAAIEDENPALAGVLPRTYQEFSNDTLVRLLRSVNSMLGTIRGDAFGKVYEYFLGKFAIAEGQKGGEYFTPTSIVRLIVEIIEPFNGKILDPACGSGGMFVQSARFVDEHRNGAKGRLSIYGQERVEETAQALHDEPGGPRAGGADQPVQHVLRGSLPLGRPVRLRHGESAVQRQPDRQGQARGRPSVSRSAFPRADNGNYIWIQIFYSALNDTGRAGFVMANSAADAGGSELDIRRKLIEDHCVDVIVAVGSNFFYTVTLPVTLWFLDRGKRETDRADKVLFIDARKIFRQIDRAHRDWLPEQIEFLANIARLYRGESRRGPRGIGGPDGSVASLTGAMSMCRDCVPSRRWSRSRSRAGASTPAATSASPPPKTTALTSGCGLEELNEELEKLNAEAAVLQERIATNVAELLG